MLYKLLFILLMITANIGFSQDPNFYIFLCFGQSNMEGQGAIQSQDRTVNSRFKVLQAVDCSNNGREKAEWYDAVPPLCRCWSGLSPADYFGRTLVDSLPEHIKIGVINVSVGGCRIELFDKDIYENYTNTHSEPWFQDIIDSYEGNPYEYLLSLAKSAQNDGVIKGILLHQGESNTGDRHWPTRVKKIYDDLISDLNLEADQTPLLAGEVVHEDQNGLTASMNEIINELPGILENSYVISSSGCTAKSDDLHFDAAGYRELGRRYGTKMLQLLEYNENAPLAVDHSFEQKVSIYPNPVSNSTTFAFSLKETAQVTLTIYNMLGQEVLKIPNDTLSAGDHSISADLSSLKSGVYLCEFLANNQRGFKRISIE